MILDQLSFDALVIGSGATGGWAAKELCEQGLRVLVLEAGPPSAELRAAACTSAPPRARQPVQSTCYAYNANTWPYFVDDRAQPYQSDPQQPFQWIRVQAVGGKSLLWAGQCYRMSDYDFKAASRDGAGSDWPIGYADLQPYYDRVEAFIGVTGGVDRLPQLPDGNPATTPALTRTERLLQRAFARHGWPLIAQRAAYQQPADEPCIHCGVVGQPCIRYTNSPDSTLAAARRTGRLTLRSNALVRRILTDETGRATGVAAIDRETHAEFVVSARLIFVCASTLESTRIMLNSRTPQHPAGLANSSGVLGRYLADHVHGISVTGLIDNYDQPDSTARYPRYLYMPRWQNLEQPTHPGFKRGYAYKVSLTRLDHTFDPAICLCGGRLEGQPMPPTPPAAAGKLVVSLDAFGEMLPQHDNYVEIDLAGTCDRWGIPVLRIHCRHSENEIAMAEDMAATGTRILRATAIKLAQVRNELALPGACIHETGTCRMGDDPRGAVLNKYNQCHDVANVFVTDGSAFPSQGTQNPTLTMMALTVRACAYAVDQLRNGLL